MITLSGDQKCSKRTTLLYWEVTKAVLWGTGLLLVAPLTALVTRPTRTDVAPWTVILMSFLGAGAFFVVMVMRMRTLYASIAQDKRRIAEGLPLEARAGEAFRP